MARPACPARLVALVALALAAWLAGCTRGNGDDKRVERADLSAIVLQPGDLPARFVRFDEGELAPADYREGPRFERDRFGREGGWKARYQRPGATTGLFLVESLADAFEDAGGAKDDLAAYRAELAGRGKLVAAAPAVGEDAVAGSERQGSGRFAVRFYTVAWRRANVTASLAASGREGEITLANVLLLARRQDARIRERL